MADLMKPNPHRRSTSHGVGHDGRKRATVPNAPGMHRPMDARALEVTAHPDIGGKPASVKAHDVVPVHGGMNAPKTLHAKVPAHIDAAPINNEPLSLDPTVSKNLTPPKAAAGMRTR